MTTAQDLINMDTEHLRRLTVLETKLDYLIEHSNNSNTNMAQISARVDKLEDSYQWLTGGAAVFAITSGILVFALQVYARNIVTTVNADTNYLQEVCSDIRDKRLPKEDFPALCNL